MKHSKTFIYLLILIFLSILTGCSIKSNRITEVACFKEDQISAASLKNYKITAFNIADGDKVSTPDIWITYGLLSNKHNVEKIKAYIDDGYDIFIQGDGLSSAVAYDKLEISMENRAMVRSQEEELKDIKPPLKRKGVLIFKYKDVYYCVGNNVQDENNLNSLLWIFNYNKKLLID